MKTKMLGWGVLGGLCAMLFTGCRPQDATTQEGVDRTFVIGISIPAATHGWTGGVNYHAERTAARLGALYPNVRFQISAARDASAQANDLEDLVQIHGIDALVILPFASNPLTEPVRAVKQQGVYTVVVDRGLEDPAIQDVYVAGNNYEMGQVSAGYIVDALNGSGKIVVLRGIPTVIDNQRVEGFNDRIAGTNIEVLDSEYANWNRDDGFEVMQDFLTRFPEIDAVWAQDDDTALGVIAAVKQVNRQDELFIVGGAGMKGVIQRVMNGDRLTPVTVLYPPAMISTAIEVTVAHLKGQVPVAGSYILGTPLITQDNAKQYYFPDSPY